MDGFGSDNGGHFGAGRGNPRIFNCDLRKFKLYIEGVSWRDAYTLSKFSNSMVRKLRPTIEGILGGGETAGTRWVRSP